MRIIEGERASNGPQPVELRWRPGPMRYPCRRSLGTLRRPAMLRVVQPVTEAGSAWSPVRRPPEWLDVLYRLCEEGKEDAAVDLVIDAVDDLLHVRDLPRCDEILKLADVERLSVRAMLALLMETFRARSGLPSRLGFYEQVDGELRSRLPDARVDALLATLK
jgi:hypothetical protein